MHIGKILRIHDNAIATIELHEVSGPRHSLSVGFTLDTTGKEIFNSVYSKIGLDMSGLKKVIEIPVGVNQAVARNKGASRHNRKSS